MREGWVDVTLGAICESTSNIKWSEYDGDSLDYIDLTSVDRDSLTITETTKVTSDNAPSRARKIIHENDVIFATTRPTLGRVTTIGREYHNQICSTGYAVLRPMAGVVTTRFIYYFILSESFMRLMESLQRGASYPAVSEKDVKQSSLKIPKLIEEQKQIVAILDDAFAAIEQAQANIEKNIENAKELFQSKLNEIFNQKGEGWEVDFFGKVFSFRQGIQRGVKLQSEQRKEGQVRFIRIVDYTQGNELPRYIDNPGKQYLLSEKDISLVRYGASTGFVCRGIEGALANNLFRVIPKGKYEISSDFLYYFLNSPVFQNYIKRKMSGAAMPAISFSMITEIPFPITSIENQANISHKIIFIEEEIDKILELYQQKLKNLEDLKKSLLEQAFAGTLPHKDMPA